MDEKNPPQSLAEEIKQRWLLKINELENLLLNARHVFKEDDYLTEEAEEFSYKLERFCDRALDVAEFLMECALAVKDFELAGIAEAVRKRAQEAIDIVDRARRYDDGETDEEDRQWFTLVNPEDLFGLSTKWAFQVLKTLGYVTGDSPYAVIVPTDKAAGLFKYEERAGHKFLWWDKKIAERIAAELGRGGLNKLLRDVIKREDDADWEASEWVTTSQLAKRIDPRLPAPAMNKALEAAGYQVKKRDGWWATEKAEGLSYQEGIRSGTPRILWKKEMIDHIKENLN